MEPSSLQEEKHPELEENEMVLGGWIRNRREEHQLEGNETHKKPRTSTPLNQHKRETNLDEEEEKGGKEDSPDGWKN